VLQQDPKQTDYLQTLQEVIDKVDIESLSTFEWKSNSKTVDSMVKPILPTLYPKGQLFGVGCKSAGMMLIRNVKMRRVTSPLLFGGETMQLQLQLPLNSQEMLTQDKDFR